MTTIAERLPCPFCGGVDIYVKPGTGCCQCQQCAAEGPISDDGKNWKQSAIDKWNHRIVADEIDRLTADYTKLYDSTERRERDRLTTEVEHERKLSKACSRDCNATALERNELRSEVERKDAVLRDCCIRMERAQGILREHGNWWMLDTTAARKELEEK